MTEQKLPPINDFQKAILWAVESTPTEMACSWTVAQKAFPDRWKDKKKRGALVSRIVVSCSKMRDLVEVIPADNTCSVAVICKKRSW